MYPDGWQKKYAMSRKLFKDNMSKIDTYMKLIKQEADKNQKKKNQKKIENANRTETIPIRRRKEIEIRKGDIKTKEA